MNENLEHPNILKIYDVGYKIYRRENKDDRRVLCLICEYA